MTLFLHESSSGIEIRLYTDYQLLRYSGRGVKVFGFWWIVVVAMRGWLWLLCMGHGPIALS